MEQLKEFYTENKKLFLKQKKFTRDEFNALIAAYAVDKAIELPTTKSVINVVAKLAYKDGYNFIRGVLNWDSDSEDYKVYHIFTKHTERPYLDVFPKKK